MKIIMNESAGISGKAEGFRPNLPTLANMNILDLLPKMLYVFCTRSIEAFERTELMKFIFQYLFIHLGMMERIVNF